MFERAFVWLGGALFVASLAASVYEFVIGWAESGPTRTVDSVGWDVALLAVFAAHHSLFARERAKRAVERLVPGRLVRSLYVWTASLLLLTVLVLWRPIGGTVYRTQGLAAFVLIVVQLGGVWLIARSVATIDLLELAGIRARPARNGLRVAGPYRLVRHPLYLGWLLAVFGAPHMTGDRLAFAAVTTIYLFAAISWEERSLRAEFGDEYVRYQRQVRWRILPYVF